MTQKPVSYEYSDDADVLVEAVQHLQPNWPSVFPLQVLCCWLDRSPEAREAFAKIGLHWESPIELAGGSDEQRSSVPESVARYEAEEGVPECCFRAHIGGAMTNCKLLGVVGRLIKVVYLTRSNVKAITTVNLGMVSPVDRERVESAIKNHPGSSVELTFDPDDQTGPS